MGATLTGTRISDTYDSLLKATDNGIITSSAKQITDGVGTNTPLYISTTRIGIGVSPTTTFQVAGNSKIGGDLTVTGDLLVEGTTTTVDTDTLSVKDPLIIVGNDNNTSDLVDLGFYGLYDTSGSQDLYAGLYRSASTTKFHLFKDLQEEPTTTVNTSGTGYTKADLVIGNLETTQIDLQDNQKIRIGVSQDLEIYHNATNSFIDNDTGSLYIRNNAIDESINIQCDANGSLANYITAEGLTGEVTLYWNGSTKLVTKSNGIAVTGIISNLTDPSAAQDAATKNYVDTQISANNELSEVLANGNTSGANDIIMADDQRINFGTSNAFNLRWSTTAASGQGASIIDSNRIFIETNFFQLNSRTGESMIRATGNSNVELYYDNSKKLETTSTGVSVTGNINLGDNEKIIFGDGGDIEMFFNSSTFVIDDTSEVQQGIDIDTNRVRFRGTDLYMEIGNAQHTFWTNGTQRLQINSSGVNVSSDFTVNTDTLFVDYSADSVGIGLTNPADYSADELVISVPDDSGMTLVSATTDTAYIRFADGTTAADQANFISHDHSTNTLTIFSQAKVSIGILEAEVAYFTDTAFFVDKSTTIDDTLTVNGNSTFAGNVGIGVTPSTSFVDSRAIEIGANGYIWSEQTAGIYNSFMTGIGFYYNAAGATIYKTTNLQISRHVQYQGEHLFQYAAAGTAGGAITWSEAFRTSDTGNVGIGTTLPDYKLHIERTGDVMMQLKATDSNQAYMKLVNSTTGDGKFTDGLLFGLDNDESCVFWNYEATPLRFATSGTERMRIDSSGNLLLGNGVGNPYLAFLSAGGNGGNERARIFGYADGGTYGGGLEIQTRDSANIFQNRMRIDSSGNATFAGNVTTNTAFIALGSLPALQASSIFIDSPTATINRLGVTGANTTTKGTFVISQYSSDGSLGADTVTIDSSGRVGIGTTALSETLQVNGNIRVEGVGNVIGFDTTGALLSNGIKTINDYETLIYNGRGASGFAVIGNSNIRLGFGTNYTNAETDLFIDSSGNVGIGTTSPDANLQVVGAGQDQIRFGTSTSVYTDLWMGTGYTVIDSIGGSAGGFDFRDDGTSRMFIDSSGNVIIKQGILEVQSAGNVAETNKIKIGTHPTAGYGSEISTSTLYNSFLSTDLRFSTTNTSGTLTERMRITSGGDVLIDKTTAGIANDGIEFNPNGQSIFTCTGGEGINVNRKGTDGNLIRFFNDGTLCGRISQSGNTTSYVTSSDYRLKENVVELTDALDRVSQLKPSRFNFIADADKTVDGFLAHEVQEIVPEAISGEKDAVDEEGNPEYQGIDQSKLVPLLVGAIQELKAEVELLKTQINN